MNLDKLLSIFIAKLSTILGQLILKFVAIEAWKEGLEVEDYGTSPS